MEVALRGWSDAKHLDIAASAAGLQNFRLVKEGESGKIVPCNDTGVPLQPHFPMAFWHKRGHFEAVVLDVPQPEAKKPEAKKPAAAKKQQPEAKEPAAVKEGGDGWTLLGKNGRAKRNSTIGKVCTIRFFGGCGSNKVVNYR